MVPPFPIPKVPENDESVRQLLPTAKQPAAIEIPSAKVEVALPLWLKFKTERPPKKVEVEVLEDESEVMLVVPAERVPMVAVFAFSEVEVAVPRYELPETEKAVDDAYGNCDARVEEAKYAGAVYGVVVAFVVVPKVVRDVQGQKVPVTQVGQVTALVESVYWSGDEKVVVAACRRA